MTHFIRLRLIRTAASMALAITMLYAGPVLASFHKASPSQVAQVQVANITIAYKTLCVTLQCHDTGLDAPAMASNDSSFGS